MVGSGSPTRDGVDVAAWFGAAEEDGRVGWARKASPVDARPARPGEIVVTVIRGEGVETRSQPAREGDWVVRSRCAETGNEEYLVGAASFARKYSAGSVAGSTGPWREFRPDGGRVRFARVRPEDGSFSFVAPWGEPMVAHPGDVIVQNPSEEKDVYRIAKAAFDCTYEVVEEPCGQAK